MRLFARGTAVPTAGGAAAPAAAPGTVVICERGTAYRGALGAPSGRSFRCATFAGRAGPSRRTAKPPVGIATRPFTAYGRTATFGPHARVGITVQPRYKPMPVTG